MVATLARVLKDGCLARAVAQGPRPVLLSWLTRPFTAVSTPVGPSFRRRLMWVAVVALVSGALTSISPLVVRAPAAGAMAAPTPAGSNLLANADFTGGFSNWLAWPGTNVATYSGSGLPVGSTYLQANAGTSSLPNFYQVVPVAVQAGQSYQGSIWVRAASGASVTGSLVVWGLGGASEAGVTRFTVGSAWTEVEVAFNATSAHSYLQLQLYLGGANQYDFLDAQLTPQLLSNADFTGGFSKWLAWPGTNVATYSGSGLPVGSTYLQANAGTSSLPNFYQVVPVAVQAGQSYQGSIWVRAASGASVTGSLVVWGLGGASEAGVTRFTVGSAWTEVEVAFNATSAHSYLQLQLYLGGANQYDFLDAQLTPQLLSNADFTGGFSKWLAWPGTNVATYSGSGLPVGSTYLQADAGTSSLPNFYQVVPVAVQAGQSYQGSIWVRAASGASVTGSLVVWGLGGASEAGVTRFTVGSAWTEVEVAFNATSAHSYLQLQVYLGSSNEYQFLDPELSESPPPVTGTGPYGFEDQADATTAITQGWPGIGSVSGFCLAPSSAYACPTGADANMETALTNADSKDFWLSFWTIGAPVPGQYWYTDGLIAGEGAAKELVALPGRLPTFEILDPEGFGGAPGTSMGWANFARGWAAGLKAVSGMMNPALYASQYLISTYGLLSIGIPIFPAVSPILGNSPSVGGIAVHGYIAYYAACPAASYVSRINGWGAAYNTLQFTDSTVNCGP